MSDDGYKFPVDLTSIMLFASALGETNRAYYDEEYAVKQGLGGVIPPPTFSTAGSHWDPKAGLRGVRQIPAPPPEPDKPPAESGTSAGGGQPQRWSRQDNHGGQPCPRTVAEANPPS